MLAISPIALNSDQLQPIFMAIHGMHYLHLALAGQQAVTIHWTGLLDWTTGLTFDLKCSIYMKKFMFYLCEKNYIDRAHGFFA